MKNPYQKKNHLHKHRIASYIINTDTHKSVIYRNSRYITFFFPLFLSSFLYIFLTIRWINNSIMMNLSLRYSVIFAYFSFFPFYAIINSRAFVSHIIRMPHFSLWFYCLFDFAEESYSHTHTHQTPDVYDSRQRVW